MIGIDIGTMDTVIAAVKKGGIEIVLSDSSGRAIP
jgi:molecular chaperone DnaK (HSP70)